MWVVFVFLSAAWIFAEFLNFDFWDNFLLHKQCVKGNADP